MQKKVFLKVIAPHQFWRTLYDGENTNILNENITNFSFSKSEFNLKSNFHQI